MNASFQQTNREGLPLVRLAMIVSSLSPLFLLWAIRGVKPFPDKQLVPACVLLIVVPNFALILRIWIAKRRKDIRTIAIKVADDPRDHLLVYLFAMLIPLIDANIGSPRDSAATIVALLLVIFLFWHLNLHYMNVLFAILGYRVFTVRDDDGSQVFVVLSKRASLPPQSSLRVYRLSNTVYIEQREA
jgi:hypothetical protein